MIYGILLPWWHVLAIASLYQVTMSVSWAITDKRYERQPWKRENFDGYFTDIRRAARKSLPRRPNKDLCGLLGLPLPSQRSLTPGASLPRQSIADDLRKPPVSLKPVTLQETDNQRDVENQSGRVSLFFNHWKYSQLRINFFWNANIGLCILNIWIILNHSCSQLNKEVRRIRYIYVIWLL